MEELFQTSPETLELTETEVTGTIPQWLSGSLLRNAPAKYEIGKHSYKHWFDGLALLHCFFIDKGAVTYRSKYIRSKAFVKGEQQNRIAYTEFGTPEMPDPCQNIFSRFFSYFSLPERTDNTQVNVFGMKGRVFTSSDSSIMNEIQPDTLDLVDVANMKTDVAISGKIVHVAAHSHEDLDGNVYHMCTSLGRQAQYNVIQVPPITRASYIKKEKPFHGATVVGSARAHDQPVYYHSFALTPNYFVFVENPFSINGFEVLTMKVVQRSFHDCLHWDPKKPSRFYLIERETKSCVATFEAQSFFSFHHINAFEDGDEVIVDLCCYPDASIINQFYLCHLRNSKPEEVSKDFADAEARRYRLKIPRKNLNNNDRDTSSFLQYEILGSNLELPRINYRQNGLPYRYVYGSGPREHGHFFDQLVKLDIVTKRKLIWYEQDCYPSEPVFVARPGGKDEDDGVIVSAVVGIKGQNSFLVVLDASNFEELARATLPVRLPQSLHGNFFPSLSYQLESFHSGSSKIPQ